MALNIESVLHEKAQYLTKDETSTINDMSALIVIDGIAIVDEVKAKKLTLFLLKKIQPFGSVVKNDIFFPMDPETGNSLGIAILEMRSAEEAKKVIEGLDNTPMDRSHTFHVYRYADLANLLTSKEELVLPEKESYAPLKKVQSQFDNLHSYMEDEFQRDQFVIRYQNNTKLLWCDSPRPESISLPQGSELSASLDQIMWSPMGSYLATFHAKGVILHGGNEFKECGRLTHTGVTNLDFSKQERYAITWNGLTGNNNKDAVILWDVASNSVIRKFPCINPKWPSFSISADEQFLATLGTNGIGIFTLPQAQMVTKSCFGISSISQYAWSPVGSTLAYIIPESNGKPATVVLLDVATDRRVQSVSFTNVENISMKWSPDGNHLAVIVSRYPKKKGKNLTYQISLVRLSERNAPIDTLALTEDVECFEWEPLNSRFAVLTQDKKEKHNISIYSMYLNKGNTRVPEVTLLYTIPDRVCNRLIWSPMGNYLLIAGLGSTMKGSLEFWDVSGQISLNKQDHFSCNTIQWSPNGHFCATSSCYNTTNKQDFENGYNLWDNRGEKVYVDRLPKFISLQFRPWPLTALPEEKKKEIKKNLTAVSEKYREQQEKAEMLKHIGDIRKQLAAIEAYRSRRERMLKRTEELNTQRAKLYGFVDEMVEVTRLVEGTVLEEKEEVC